MQDSITLNAYAKINWRLQITGIRPNGYHELDMFMQTISLHDVLHVKKSSANKLTINKELCAEPEKNLVIRAANALSKYTHRNISAEFDLEKRIPSMAGLGGGSSDCAKALEALNTLYELKLTDNELNELALNLGADVPFFLSSGLNRVRGIGERVDKIAPAPRFNLLIYHVPNGLSTQAVYKKYDEMCKPRPSLDDNFAAKLLSADFSSLNPVNNLEAPAIALLPAIESCKRAMKDLGSVYTLMSGSGSAVYGVFESETAAREASELLPGSIAAQTTD